MFVRNLDTLNAKMKVNKLFLKKHGSYARLFLVSPDGEICVGSFSLNYIGMRAARGAADLLIEEFDCADIENIGFEV